MYLRCSCGKRSRLREERAGRRAFCPSCGAKFRLPSVEFIAAHEGGTIDDAPRVVVEYVSGGGLDEQLDGPLDLERLLRWGTHTCRGMSYAHGQGLVHRDLKPPNVLLDEDGVARITDFGLAKQVRAEDTGDAEAERVGPLAGVGLSQVGKFMGTAAYAAPERWLDASSVGPAADIYSFGVMLYQMAGGRLPFWPSREGETFESLHSSADPPGVLALRPDLPEAAARVIDACLAKEPEDRPTSFDEVESALDDAYAAANDMRSASPVPDEERRKRDLNNRAVTLVDLGRSSDALRALSQAVELDPLFVRASIGAVDRAQAGAGLTGRS